MASANWSWLMPVFFRRVRIASPTFRSTGCTRVGVAMCSSPYIVAGLRFKHRFGALVGEQGERLSGGQIQKLELARLAGISVPTVILDESTSSLDPRSEGDVISSVRKVFGTRTTLIVITHRPALALMADQVLFMRAGRLVAVGAHEDLLDSAPGYANLWNVGTNPN